MPYKNIVFVKLLWKELLLEDNRFTDQCNDEQKGLYLMLLLLAGATNNNIPSDENYLIRTLNLVSKPEIVAKNRDCLLSIFPKLIQKNGYLKFKKFKGLHNYIRSAQGQSQEIAVGMARIDKNRIDKIRREYIALKGWQSQTLSKDFFGRSGRAIKQLLLLGDVDTVTRSLQWVSKRGYCDWTLETCIKKFPDFLASKKTDTDNGGWVL